MQLLKLGFKLGPKHPESEQRWGQNCPNTCCLKTCLCQENRQGGALRQRPAGLCSGEGYFMEVWSPQGLVHGVNLSTLEPCMDFSYLNISWAALKWLHETLCHCLNVLPWLTLGSAFPGRFVFPILCPTTRETCTEQREWIMLMVTSRGSSHRDGFSRLNHLFHFVHIKDFPKYFL